MKEKLMGLKNKVLLGGAVTAGLIVSAAPALAETTPNPVVTGIQTAVTSVSGDAATVIGAAIGLSVIFWGAKVLWSKFRSMAK